MTSFYKRFNIPLPDQQELEQKFVVRANIVVWEEFFSDINKKGSYITIPLPDIALQLAILHGESSVPLHSTLSRMGIESIILLLKRINNNFVKTARSLEYIYNVSST